MATISRLKIWTMSCVCPRRNSNDQAQLGTATLQNLVHVRCGGLSAQFDCHEGNILLFNSKEVVGPQRLEIYWEHVHTQHKSDWKYVILRESLARNNAETM